MSKVGDLQLLKKIAGLLDILDGKQFPPVIDTGDIKAVIDIGQFIDLKPQEFLLITEDVIGGAGGSSNWDIFRVGGLDANGTAVFQKNIGEKDQSSKADGPHDGELFNYRIHSSGFKITMDAAANAAEATNGINWKFELVRSNEFAAILSPNPSQSVDLQYHTANVGQGLAFDPDSGVYHICNQSGNSGNNSSGSATPFVVPGKIGAGLLLNLIHRTSGGAGPSSGWTAVGSTMIQTFCYGLRYPKGYKGPW